MRETRMWALSLELGRLNTDTSNVTIFVPRERRAANSNIVPGMVNDETFDSFALDTRGDGT